MLFLKSKLLHVGVMLLLAFLPLAMFFGPVNLYLFVGSLLVTTSAAVVVAYWPLLWLAFNMTVDKVKLVDILTLAIPVTFFAVGMREGYVTLYREFYPLPTGAGRPPEYFLPIAFTQYAAVAGGLLALAALNVEKGESFMYNLPGWPRAVLAIAAGSIIGAILMAIHP